MSRQLHIAPKARSSMTLLSRFRRGVHHASSNLVHDDEDAALHRFVYMKEPLLTPDTVVEGSPTFEHRTDNTRFPLGRLSINRRQRKGRQLQAESKITTIKTPTASVDESNKSSSSNLQQYSKHSIIALEDELHQLRCRVQAFGNESERSELVSVIENQRRAFARQGMEMKQLEQKLYLIENGLADIDAERESLTNTITVLMQEKAQLDEQLALRERELVFLTKRCGEQAEAAKLSIHLKQENAELRSRVCHLEEAETEKASIHSQLEACRIERDVLLTNLDALAKRFEETSKRLKLCEKQMNLLSEEKTNWEQERARLLQKADIDFDIQRRHYEQQAHELQDHLRLSNVHIKNINAELLERTNEVTDLKDEVERCKDSLSRQILSSQREHEEKIQQLVSNYQIETIKMKSAHNDEVSALQNEIAEKNSEIRELLSSIEIHKADIKNQASSHEKEIRHFSDSIKTHKCLIDVEKSKTEKELQRCLEEKNQLLDALETEVWSQAEQIRRLKEENEDRVSGVQSEHEARHNNLKKDSMLTIELLKKAFREKEKSMEILKMELSRLTDIVASHETESERLTQELCERHKQELMLLQDKLQNESCRLSEEYKSRDELVESLEQKLARCVNENDRLAAHHAEQIENLNSLHKAKIDELSQTYDKNLRNYSDEISSMEEEIESLRSELCTEKEKCRLLEQQIDRLSAPKAKVTMLKEAFQNSMGKSKDDAGCMIDKSSLPMNQRHLVSLLYSQLKQKDDIIARLNSEITQQQQINEVVRKQSEQRVVSMTKDLRVLQDELETERSYRVDIESSKRLREKGLEESLQALERKLLERNSLLESLQEELASQMEKLMEATAELERVNDDRYETCAQLNRGSIVNKSVSFEDETRIEDMAVEILKLEIEKELLLLDSGKNEELSADYTMELAESTRQIRECLDNLSTETELLKQFNSDVAKMNLVHKQDPTIHHNVSQANSQTAPVAENDVTTGRTMS